MPMIATAKDVKVHMDQLAVKIGNRLAGTPGELKAAKYIQKMFRKYGLTGVRQELFPCVSWSCKVASFSVKDGNRWRRITCLPLAHSKCTKGKVEADLVYLETASERDLRGKDLKGKIGLLFGSFGSV